MTAVRAILEELGISESVTAIGVAKGMDRDAGRERFFVQGKPPFTLPPRDPVLYFVQRLRDEAHRFAIGSHRARRKKEMVKNPLDEIERHRAVAQAGAVAPFRHGQGGIARGDRGSFDCRGHFATRWRNLIYDHFHDERGA